MAQGQPDYEQTRLGGESVSWRVPNDYEGQLGNGKDVPTVLETDGDEERCPCCGEWYSRIGLHWAHGDCPHPPVSQYKMDLLKGFMMGDGSLSRDGNPRFSVYTTNKTFVDWLFDELGWLSTTVSVTKTSKEQSQSLSDGLNDEYDAGKCYDLYKLRTRSHPLFQRFVEWYNTGEIVFPDDLTLEPNVLKIWFISDGSFTSKSRIRFTSLNESERPEVILGALEELGFTPSLHGKSNFVLSTHDTKYFFDYIGHDPVPGFKYKWAWQDRDRYKRLKAECDEKHKTQTGLE